MLSISPKAIPLGRRIPDSPHAVSVSLPRMQDVYAYEEKEPRTLGKLCSGYPRFVKHPFIQEFSIQFMREFELDGNAVQPFFFASTRAKEDALATLKAGSGVVSGALPESFRFYDTDAVVVDKGSEAELQLVKYLQHTGAGLSSREVEDLLYAIDRRRIRFPESRVLEDHEGPLERLLLDWFRPEAKSVVLPCKSGMNAFYSAFQAVNQIQNPRGRKDWISIGWLYLDTIQILDLYLPEGGVCHSFSDVGGIDSLVDFIRSKGQDVAGLVLEAPTNPLVQCPDVVRISEVCREAGILTIMDPSLVSPMNVDLSPYCDVVSCSLTKYAAHRGDVMIGANCVNLEREHGQELQGLLEQYQTPAYHRDLDRLGVSLLTACDVLDAINRNTMEMAAFFKGHPGVKRMYWAYSDENAGRYEKIHRSSGRPGGVITLELNHALSDVYDRLPLPKGPSFGMAFTLVCPYLHLAHFDLLQTDVGLKFLWEAGMPTNMIRLSVGMEDAEELKAIFDRVL